MQIASVDNTATIPQGLEGQVSSETGKAHLAHLDGLRAILALYVVAHHVFLTIWPSYSLQTAPPPPLRAVMTPMEFGRFAVDGFIVLSGFCLALPIRSDPMFRVRGGAARFYWKRCRRILPTFWAALVLSIVLDITCLRRPTGGHWDACIPVNIRAVAANLLMLQDLIQPFRINHAFWSVAVEFRIYFLFPLLLWSWRRFGPVRSTLAVSLGCTVIGVSMHFMPLPLLATTTPSYISLFCLGALTGYVAGVRGAPRLRHLGPLGLVLMAAAILLDLRFHAQVLEDLLCGLAFCALLYLTSADGRRSLARSMLSTRWLAAVGIFAYSVYLTHAPIIQMLWQYLVKDSGLAPLASFLVLEVLAIPIAILVAYVFFWLFERPFLSVRQTIAAKQELTDVLHSKSLIT